MSEKTDYTNVSGTLITRETALANAAEGLQFMAAGAAKVFTALCDLLETPPNVPAMSAQNTTCRGKDNHKTQDVVSEPTESLQNAPGETIGGDPSQRCTPGEEVSEGHSKAKEGPGSGEGINGDTDRADHTAADHIQAPSDHTATPAVPTITPDDITRAAVALIRRDRKNSQKIQALLQTYGVSQMSALEPDKYDAFMRDLADLDKA